MTIKVREGVKAFLDKAKSRSVPITFGDHNDVRYRARVIWIPEDYSMHDEARLLTYCNTSVETLINSTHYDLDNNGKYIKMKYTTQLDLQPKSLDQSSKLSIQNMSKTDDITEDVKILYHWEYSEGLSLPMMSTISAAVSDSIRNGDNFMKTIILQRDYRTCTFNRYDVEAIFQLKSIINYRLELMRSSALKKFYDNIVEFVIMQKYNGEEIRRMVGINVDNFQVYDDGGSGAITSDDRTGQLTAEFLEINPSSKISLKRAIVAQEFVLHLAAAVTAGIHMLSLTTVGAVPKHRCLVPALDYSLNVTKFEKLENFILKLDNGEFDFLSHIYNTIYYKSSRRMEWNTLCDRRWMGAVAQSAFMFGVFIGAITPGSTAPKYGRKIVFYVSALLQLGFGIAAAFVTSFYPFLIIQIFYGTFSSADSYLITAFALLP
ncbi:hypothetical protein FQA39_LY09688 [Lamprigera yunnana]|nr:hypothetical protein FQA39_LY09688 [Lamprigera yunnana]